MQIPWRFTGFLIQGAMIAAVLAVPMLYPEIIAVTLPKIGVTLTHPPRQAAAVQKTSPAAKATQGGQSLAIARRVYTAPKSWNSPVQQIIDAPSSFLESIGSGQAQASSLPPSPLTEIGTTAPPPPPPPAAAPVTRIAVGGAVQEARILHQVKPVYPTLAIHARIQGTVRLSAVIAEDGTVRQLQVVSGHPLLTGAALQAVRQWRYQSTRLNGFPVEVATTIDVNFVLGR